MVGIIAKLKVKDGSGPQFEEAAQRLVEAVRANEPDCLLYTLARLPNEPNTYLMVERYKDQAARESHGKTEHFRTLGAALGPFMAGRPELTQFEEL